MTLALGPNKMPTNVLREDSIALQNRLVSDRTYPISSDSRVMIPSDGQ